MKRIQKIGEGAFGEVYLCEKGIVCKKTIFSSKIHKNECEFLSKLNHPNIIKYIDHDMECLYMEYGGNSLHRLIIHKNKVKEVMIQITSALAYLHVNYIHRDLSEKNIVIDNNYNVKIIDFGTCISKNSEKESFRVCHLWYSSPEILLGTDEYSTEVDMWSLGCLFYLILIGETLFHGDIELVQLLIIFRRLGLPKNDTLTSLPDWRTDFPSFEYDRNNFKEIDDLQLDLLLKMLEYEPSKRITAVDALQHDYFRM